MHRLDFLRHADECGKWAQQASSEQARKVWRDMEQYWRRRGGALQDAELQDAIGGLLAELRNGPRGPQRLAANIDNGALGLRRR